MAKLLILNKGSNLVLKSEIEVVSILVMLNKILEDLEILEIWPRLSTVQNSAYSCKNNKDGSYVVLTILCDKSFI